MNFIKLPSGNFINMDKIAYIDIGKVIEDKVTYERYVVKTNDGEPVYAFFLVSLKDVLDFDPDCVPHVKEKFNSIQEAEKFFEKIEAGYDKRNEVVKEFILNLKANELSVKKGERLWER